MDTRDARLILVEELRKTGLSQRQIARRIGVAQPTVQSWLAGDCLPDLATVRKIIAPRAFPALTPLAYDILRPERTA